MSSSALSDASSVEDLFPLIYHRIDLAVRELDHMVAVQDAVRQLVTTLPEESAMVSVPLLVHAAETGDPRPAVPVAAVHVLWWTAAHVFDDFIDNGVTEYPCGLSSGEALMAAVVCGMSLPTIIAAQDFPGTLLPDMIREFSSAWTVSNDGQIRDLQTVPEEANCRRVLTTYRHKTGAAYGAVSAMAARLGGCIDMRSTLWRRFGETLGCVGQFRNDQEDFVSGRDEDLKNGTATFLLYCLLDSLGESGRRHHLGLLRHARTSAVAREEVKQAMLTPDVIDVYLGHIDALRVEALGLLDALDADGTHGHRLREFVEQAATPVPLFAAAALEGAGPGQLGVRLAPSG